MKSHTAATAIYSCVNRAADKAAADAYGADVTEEDLDERVPREAYPKVELCGDNIEAERKAGRALKLAEDAHWCYRARMRYASRAQAEAPTVARGSSAVA